MGWGLVFRDPSDPVILCSRGSAVHRVPSNPCILQFYALWLHFWAHEHNLTLLHAVLHC